MDAQKQQITKIARLKKEALQYGLILQEAMA